MPSLICLLQKEPHEGYMLYVNTSDHNNNVQVHVVGNSHRGLVFGVGRSEGREAE